ncbi:MFS transporter [Virgibacillus alimentarius]|uniref:DHA2 family metal-tetracycline-proton antiporter-like MFS transporter n=1 Tax=Virgibacillus alimentarius TaxID=698769 RepID=A0ABS4S8E1_9BACI|nr:MFS transporter [Virgibacillus alimentarius]MBP2257759.1 DHA2 family metal-tetracycline-proton antiporter-like MFS transporter [Virgibacillus alimentarius]
MKKQLKFLIATTWFITLFASLNINMFNLGIPQIANTFDLNSSEASWITSGFILFTGISAITFGKLADIYPTRWLMMIGIGILTAGSLIGILSQNFWMIVIARMIQGAGAGAFPSVSMVMAAKFYPPHKRGLLIGIIMSSITFGAGFGPLVGGYLTHLLGWRILFGLSLFSVVGLPLLWRFTPKETTSSGHIDVVGAFLCVLTALFLLLSVQIHLSFLVLAAIFGLMMAWQSKRSKDPFFRIEIFKNIPYSMSALMVFMVNLCHIAAYFVLPLMLIHVNGLNEAWAGLIIFPGAVLSAFAGGPIGNMTDKYGPSMMVRWATLIMAAVFLLISTVVGHSYIWVMFAIFFEYVSYSINQVAITSFASKSLDMEEVGAGMGMLNLLLYVGMAIGTAIFGRVLTLDMGKWNPLSDSPFHAYSNAFLILGILILTVIVFSAIAKQASGKKERVNAP